MYGPGGHGKSELTMAYLAEKGIDPYVITMGTGMTTDRLFGGLDIPTFEKTGKIEYLVENSFMNNEYVIFEELFDAPDFILEQLKDILSSKIFRNGTQIFPIKTKFIICCTNRTREEFSKNASLKALMERFPLELNVIWDNYNEASYNKLLETKFGQGNVDPIIPFLLQEYHRGGVTISPRVAVTAYQVYEECGPDSLNFIAEFAKKPALITDTLKKYQNTLKFRKLSSDLDAIVRDLQANNLVTDDEKNEFNNGIGLLASNIKDIKKLTVSDDLAATHASLIKSATDLYTKLSKKQTVSSIME
jgi:MoxR-like ATPase